MSIAQEIQRLQTSKANIKAAIEGKGVTVGDGTIDTYAEKISEISVGGDYEQGYEDGKNSVVDVTEYLKSGSFLNLNIFKKSKVELNLKSWANNNLINLFQITAEENRNTTVEDLTITCPAAVTTIQQMVYCQYPYTDSTLKKLTLNIDLSKCTNANNAFTQLRALEVIDGTPIDFSSISNATNTGAFQQVPSLREVRFVANSIKYSIKFLQSDKLSTDTIQSIIDGLATVDTAQTVTLHANVKILQSQVDSANAKGWTVAGGTVVSEGEYYG